jgi:hypothetical protein
LELSATDVLTDSEGNVLNVPAKEWRVVARYQVMVYRYGPEGARGSSGNSTCQEIARPRERTIAVEIARALLLDPSVSQVSIVAGEFHELAEISC